jgi:calcium/calmodulin-dependent protein kinase I
VRWTDKIDRMGCGASSQGAGSVKAAPPVSSEDLFSKKYKILKQLGEGGYAVVYSCRCKEDQSMWAVKVFEKKKFGVSGMKDVYNETVLLRKVAHDHVTGVKETIEEVNFFYIIMELIQGGEMFDRIIEHGIYTEEDARQQIRTVCETLHYCHEVGVVHLDIKPENLLYKSRRNDGTDKLKICDFGIAREVGINDTIESDGLFHGTMGYCAPEILRLSPYGSKTDVWSVGCLTYILFSGCVPFEGDDSNEAGLKELISNTCKGNFIRFNDYGTDGPFNKISQEGKDFIQKCFTVATNQRPSMAELLSTGWLSQPRPGDAPALTDASKNLKKFNAKRKLKRAVRTIISANRMKELISGIQRAEAEKSEEIIPAEPTD